MDKATEDAIIAHAMRAHGAIEEKLRTAIRMTAESLVGDDQLTDENDVTRVRGDVARPRSFRVQYRTGDLGGGSLTVRAASEREAIDVAAREVLQGRGGQFDANAWEISEPS